jgi:hypothetical protein
MNLLPSCKLNNLVIKSSFFPLVTALLSPEQVKYEENITVIEL